MFEKIKEKTRIRKEVGGKFRDADITELKEFNVAIFTDKTGERKALINIKEDKQLEVVCPFSCYYGEVFKCWIRGSNLLILINGRVFKKTIGWSTIKEIVKLRNSFKCWENGKYIAFNSFNSYYVVDMDTLEVESFDGSLHSINKVGVFYRYNKYGWEYVYFFEKEKRIIGPFQKRFNKKSEYQINALGKDVQVYRLDWNGIIAISESICEKDKIERFKIARPEKYYKINTEEEKDKLVRISDKGYKIFNIPKGKIYLIKKVFNKKYYKIIGEGKVYLMSFDENGKPIIHGEYVGDDISFSEPIIDTKNGAIKRDILIWYCNKISK